VTRTVGILSCLKALTANKADHPANLYASLTGFHPHPFRGLQGMNSLAMDMGLCGLWHHLLLPTEQLQNPLKRLTENYSCNLPLQYSIDDILSERRLRWLGQV